MQKKLGFAVVLLIELVILAAFIWYLIYLFPTLAPDGYKYYGDAPHIPYFDLYLTSVPIQVVKWFFYLFTAFMVLFMMVTILGEMFRWWLNQSKPNHHTLPDNAKENRITRFDNNFRLQHYLIMIFATLAGIIGLAQAFPDASFAQWFLGDILGDLEIKRHFHHYFAYVVDFTVVYFLGYLFYKFAVKKEKLRAMWFSWQDIKDMMAMNMYILGLRKAEPAYGRFTFGQKIDFFLIVIGFPVLSLTGLSMHYTAISEPIITGMGIALAAVIHRSVALFLAWFVLSVHLYYAHFAPDLFPVNTVILTGKMSKARYQALFPLDKERLQG
jgi:formate dehydrogenase gamma subunit